MTYAITGCKTPIVRAESRGSPASAIVLARRWEAEGFLSVEIASPGRAPRPAEIFAQDYLRQAQQQRFRRRNA